VRVADWERVLGNGCDVPLTANNSALVCTLMPSLLGIRLTH